MIGEELLEPIPPGEILRDDFMVPMGISINRLSRDLAVPPNRISGIVNGKRGISADTALRLERYFGVEAQFWLNLQSEYDLRVIKRKMGGEIRHLIRPCLRSSGRRDMTRWAHSAGNALAPSGHRTDRMPHDG